jgi:hypothetical protein
MSVYRRATTTAPRLLVVGLIVFSASCRRQQQPAMTTTVSPGEAAVPPKSVPRKDPINNAATLLDAMYDRYAGKWYRTMTFVQKTTISLASGSELHQTWHEAGAFPGRLRIDTDLASNNGVMYARDSVFSVMNGKVVRADTGRNELLILGFDVYAQPVVRTQAALRRAGFDLSKFHEETWQGKAVFVVGAEKGDTTSKQFWVERERLLFVRMLSKTPQGRSDFRFEDYREMGGGWIAMRVEQLLNGKRRLLEEYSDVKVNVSLSPALFEAAHWTTAPHWAR